MFLKKIYIVKLRIVIFGFSSDIKTVTGKLVYILFHCVPATYTLYNVCNQIKAVAESGYYLRIRSFQYFREV